MAKGTWDFSTPVCLTGYCESPHWASAVEFADKKALNGEGREGEKRLMISVNLDRLIEAFNDLVQTPSVVGFYPRIHALMKEKAAAMGYETETDNKHTVWIKVRGQDHSRVRAVAAHLDTIGMIVRFVDENGWLETRNYGGVNFHSLEGANVIVHTRSGKDYTGTVICKSHSVHVFDDARDLPRTMENMRIVLDEDVHSPEEVAALGIRHGDLISVEPNTVWTESGYVKSRHVDDKIHAAILLECLRQLAETGQRPVYDTWFAFPMFEEIGKGGAYCPAEVDEYLALDIASIGPGFNGSEKKVTICGGDRIAPYDWGLTTRLIELAEEAGLDFAVDVFYRYASDATEAFDAGQNIKPALIGTGTLSSHGYERTHLEGIKNTALLTMAYLLAE